MDGIDLPSTLEPVARFLEHAQQIEMKYKNNVVTEKITRERTRRVLEQLANLKETVSSSALGLLQKAFDFDEELAGNHENILSLIPVPPLAPTTNVFILS